MTGVLLSVKPEYAEKLIERKKKYELVLFRKFPNDPMKNMFIQSVLYRIPSALRGASPRPKGDPRYFGRKIPWIMISDISKEHGRYISKTKDTVTEEGAKRSRYLKTGTLILSNSGTACVPKILAMDGCIHDGFVAFPDLENCDEKLFLYYYFDYIRPLIIQENRQGVTQVDLNTNIVKNIEIPLSPSSAASSQNWRAFHQT